jgi:hypothetical protein
MSLEFEGLQMLEQETVFGLDYKPAVKPPTKNEARKLVTCPDLLDAANEALEKPLQEVHCAKCNAASIISSYFVYKLYVQGKCLRK